MYDGLKKLEVSSKSRHPGARRGVKYGLIGLLVLVVFVVSAGIFTYLKVKHNIDIGKREIAGLTKDLPKGPINILILGSDRRDVVEANQKNERQFSGGSGQRADTIILMHLYGGSKKAVLISFPRDLRVEIPGHGIDKINAAYPLGGANLMIKTIKQLTGLSINHYVEVNFASFQGIVNAIGGVPLYFPAPVSDRKSGLDITHAGCINLNGAQALSFVRARYIYPTADLGRIQGQQRFIRALLHKVRGLSLLLNPPKLIALSAQVGKGLVYDKDVSIGLARAIAARLAGFDQKNIDFRQYPGRPGYVGGVSYVLPDPTAARALFNSVRADGPLPDVGKTGQSLPSPSDVTITLINASGKSGLAGTERAKLVTKGYQVPTIASSSQHITPTIITYQAGDELKAELVAKEFPTATLKLATRPQSTDIIVTLGRSFANPAPAGSKTAKPTAKPAVVGSCP
jgi:LCP family protein required for cell wall assembly